MSGETDITITDWEWQSDAMKFASFAHLARAAAELFLVEMFDERCPDYEENCECCRRWKLLDELLVSPFEGEA